jgi:hypothetical protein
MGAIAFAGNTIAPMGRSYIGHRGVGRGGPTYVTNARMFPRRSHATSGRRRRPGVRVEPAMDGRRRHQGRMPLLTEKRFTGRRLPHVRGRSRA